MFARIRTNPCQNETKHSFIALIFCHHPTEKQNSAKEITPNNSFDETGDPEHHYEGAEESSVEGDNEQGALPGKKKKSKLKLLGVVPIPGTKKVYKEDRREKKAEKRMQKQSRRPAWEAGVSTGKY
jgi:hypothetical protein